MMKRIFDGYNLRLVAGLLGIALLAVAASVPAQIPDKEQRSLDGMWEGKAFNL